MLIAMAGLPATGKSYVSERLARRMGALLVSVTEMEDALTSAGLWRNETTRIAAYEAAGQVAARNLALGHDVVVDAANADARSRGLWRGLADQNQTDVVFVITVCSDADEHRRRIAEHRPNPDGTPVTRQQVFEQNMRTAFWGDEPRLTVDTSRGVDIGQVLSMVSSFGHVPDDSTSPDGSPASAERTHVPRRVAS